MRLRFALLFLLLAAQLPGVPARAEPGCREAGRMAEGAWGLPSGLMGAIGTVESGHWPWIINAAGQDYRFATREDAVAAVMSLQAQGIASIDVGCFQINLLHHPNAFASLWEAFDPATNAAYAGRFLTRLMQRLGDWDEAIAAYHSATPGLGDPYHARVLAAWMAKGGADEGMVNWGAGLPRVGGGVMISMAQAPAEAKPAATVWSVASEGMGMRVWTGGVKVTIPDVVLPRVITGRPPGG